MVKHFEFFFCLSWKVSKINWIFDHVMTFLHWKRMSFTTTNLSSNKQIYVQTYVQLAYVFKFMQLFSTRFSFLVKCCFELTAINFLNSNGLSMFTNWHMSARNAYLQSPTIRHENFIALHFVCLLSWYRQMPCIIISLDGTRN